MGENTQIMRKPLVLVAADDPDQRKLVWEVLEQFGFRIVTAEDGKSAYDLFKKTQPDAILLDIQSSDYDGFAVCDAIRKQETGGETPIFMVSDRDNEDSIEKAYRLGATDIVFNPIALPVLPHRIRYALRTARSLSDLRGLVRAIPDLIFDNNLLADKGLFVLEHDLTNTFVDDVHFTEIRKYGQCHFSFFKNEDQLT